MKYYKSEQKVISPNDFLPRIRCRYWKRKSKRSWYVKEKSGWRPASDPIQHGINVEEVSKKDVFIDLL